MPVPGAPDRPLPYADCWTSPDDYIDSLLEFATSSDLFQILCGGVHILDFFTTDPGLFHAALPPDWQRFLVRCEPMRLLDLLMRDDLARYSDADDHASADHGAGSDPGADPAPPASLLRYIRDIRRFALARDFPAPAAASQPVKKLPKMTRQVSVGMKPKKVHEVGNFAHYVDRLARDAVAPAIGGPVTHFVDFGSGQNYLGRCLASSPYNHRIVAVEGRSHNIAGARELDVRAGLVPRPRVMRNKKLWMRHLEALEKGQVGTEQGKESLENSCDQTSQQDPQEAETTKGEDPQESEQEQKLPSQLPPQDAPGNGTVSNGDPGNAQQHAENTYEAELRPYRELIPETLFKPDDGRGFIRYIEGRLESGELGDIISQVEDVTVRGDGDGDAAAADADVPVEDLRLMAVSIHSCGNLSHHGVRSLVLNPRVRAVAIVGCCYNLLTERLGPPTYKHIYMRPSLQAVNGRVVRESARRDPHGFPMSDRLCSYGDSEDEGKAKGVRLNITARMMACQAPQNWTATESDGFFTRHFFRAVLQKIFLDRGVITKVYHDGGAGNGDASGSKSTPFNTSTNPVIIGSLRKGCYTSLAAYVRGAVTKLTTAAEDDEYHDARHAEVIRERMADITDEEIAEYERLYLPRKREISAIWSLMAFSATAVEALVVADRWLYLTQPSSRAAGVTAAWAETVFDYRQSPRNLVVVGIKGGQPQASSEPEEQLATSTAGVQIDQS